MPESFITVSVCFEVNNFINSMPSPSERSIPLTSTKVGSMVTVEESFSNFANPSSEAAAISGNPEIKEKAALCAGERLFHIPPRVVMPLREVPGISARICHKPIFNA